MATDHPILTAAEMRAAEQALFDAGTSVDALMERAGAAVAELARRIGGHLPVLVLCGPGNNGGDGYVAARLLKDMGIAVRVAASSDPGTDVAKTAHTAWNGRVERLTEAAPAPFVIDALFGTGLTRALTDEVAQALNHLMDLSRVSLAVDVPSGVSTDDGAVFGDIPHFTATIALGALKPAHRLFPAAGHCGRVIVADIGVSANSSLSDISRPKLSPPAADSHKYTRGMVAVVVGVMPGAAHLAAMASQRAGAGYVVLASKDFPAGVPHALVHRVIETEDDLGRLVDDPRLDSLVIGPGLGRDGQTRRWLDLALGFEGRLVLDGDALALLGPAGLKRLSKRVSPAILTPHAGEFDALFGASTASKVDRARAAADRAGSVILFKGPDSVVAQPGGRAAIAASAAPSWLSTAGTGDVLAGIVAAFTGYDAFDVACHAVWLHGEAARRAGPAFIADDLLLHLPAAYAACL